MKKTETIETNISSDNWINIAHEKTEKY